MATHPPTDLMDYVGAPDLAFGWKPVEKSERVSRYRMTSQKWQGGEWEHDIVLVEPLNRISKGAAILYITGGEPNPLDLDEAHRLSDLSGLPVAHLFQIPNQPLYDDLWEDDLIAETLVRCLQTGDRTWPLLLPMTKSAVRAMDVLGAATHGTKNPLGRYVLTGSSKRGWTSWLTAATGDPRVVGVAPMVYDNLNLGAQLQHQVSEWHEVSEMISPYVSRGLPESLATPEGQRLAEIIDPFTYRHKIEIPKLVITGSNDPYWSVDSLGLYWDELLTPKWATTVPNAGHGLGDMTQALHSIAALARHCAGKLTIPAANWTFEKDAIEIQCGAPFPDLKLWIAESATLDFRMSEWWPRGEAGAGKLKSDRFTSKFPIPRCSRNQAAMIEMRYKIKDFEFSLSTTVKVYKA
jgi:PhoPQ-activated pathogenicity-related protein